jgi:hypothetical protein
MSQIDCNIATWACDTRAGDVFQQHVVLEDKECRLARLASRTFYSFDTKEEGTRCAKPFLNLFYKSLQERTGMDLQAEMWNLIKLEGPAFGDQNEKG